MSQDVLSTRSIGLPAQAAAAFGDRSGVSAPHDARPVAAAPRQATNAPADDPRALRAVAQQIDTFLRANGRRLEFSVDSPSGRTVITVRDPESGDVVRQIPSEEALRLARSLGDTGIALLDIKA
jgi:flagellar protein FlaG